MKKYYVLRYGHGCYTIWYGTLEQLIDAFSYTLEIGNSWDKRINKNPKTIKSFISNLNRAFAIKEAKCYDRSYVEIATKEQINLYEIEELD